MSETLDSRVLAALRFLDGETRLPIPTPLDVSASGVRVVRNRSGFYVVTQAPGFESYAASFELPAQPPDSATLELTVVDPSHRHLPQLIHLALPLTGEALFTPVDVRMYPAPAAPPAPGSAAVRLSVTNAQGQPLAWVRIRLSVAVPDGAPVLGHGLSDERGEALILMPDIPLLRWGQDPDSGLVDTSFPATLEAVLAPVTAGLPAPDIVLDDDFQSLPDTFELSAGSHIHRHIQV